MFWAVNIVNTNSGRWNSRQLWECKLLDFQDSEIHQWPCYWSWSARRGKEKVRGDLENINSCKINKKFVGMLSIWARGDKSVIEMMAVQTRRLEFNPKHPCQNQAWGHILLFPALGGRDSEIPGTLQSQWTLCRVADSVSKDKVEKLRKTLDITF